MNCEEAANGSGRVRLQPDWHAGDRSAVGQFRQGGSFTFATDKAFDPLDPTTCPTQYTVEHFNPNFILPNELCAFFAQDTCGRRTT